jgi:hypothetical protein
MMLNGTRRPRTFSTTLQKMWPPSSGRNGKRLTIASERLMNAIRLSASVTPYWKACCVTSEIPTMPWIFLRSCDSKILLKTPSVPLVTRHIALAA